jgi:tRNA dimethylallyltransferase
MERLIAIVGPTAASKSRLALHLAQQFNGEIVSADSRQMYGHMDIGTAKPGGEERALVPHHLIDILNPDEDFSLAQYQQLAYHTIADIHQRGKLPWLVGGSGLYVWAVVEGWSIPPVPPDLALRRTLAERAAKGEVAELYQELMALDPVAAQKIDPRNVRRVIRALEVTRSAGVPFSQLQQKKAPPFQTLMVGLTADRAELYRRIDARVDEMLAHGLVDEVKKLVKMGYSFNLPAMSGIGYRQIGRHLRGELSLAEAIQQIKYETHRLARHQYNWFRLSDQRIQWFDVRGGVESEIAARVAEFLHNA